MEIKQIHALINNCSLPGNCDNAGLTETHISWIILTDDFAYKIKRPVKYSFVDFSSIERRKHFCQTELKLNRRLAPEMYLDVLPVTRNMVEAETGNGEEEIIDFAVQMKRMDNNKEMDKLLEKNKVAPGHIQTLARKISDFHKQVNVIKKSFDIDNLQKNYSDIKPVASYIKENAGEQWYNKVTRCINSSSLFLKKNKDLINERVRNGYRKDCHGDLNAHNIFLYEDPVIFDCIEFNDEFRYIDVLNDIAFLCVDLDFFGREDLSELFCISYHDHFGMNNNHKTRQLLSYYKSFRANIRAKVTLISAKKMNVGESSKEILDAVKYIDLMEKYSEAI